MSEITEPSCGQAGGDASHLRAPAAWKRLLAAGARPLLITAVSLTVWWIVWLFLGRTAIRAHVAEHVILPIAILSLICIVGARHELHWARPMRRMRSLLPDVRNGEAPIEELSELRDGGIGPIVSEVQELLRDLKRQKLELSILNEEMRQRVANRTDALERLVGSLRQQATRDALTTLLNRRMFDVALPKLIETCRAEGTDLCLLIMDVDNFKQLNDTLGHAAGDELLRNLGQLIRSTVRQRDMAFRLGGDEFVVLMPGGDAESAESLSSRLVSLMDALSKTLKVSPRPSLSIGIARLLQLATGDDDAALTLVSEADKKLYEVKQARKATRQSSPAAAA